MGIAEYSTQLSLGISMLLLIVAFLLWRDYYIDNVRNDLFSLRDEVFSYAYAEGLIEHEAYRHLRASMNAVIRYAHDISAFRLAAIVFIAAIFGAPEPTALRRWRQAVYGLRADQRDAMLAFHTRMLVLIGRQVFHTSIVMRALACIAYICYLALRSGVGPKESRVAEKMRIDLLEADALAAMAPC